MLYRNGISQLGFGCMRFPRTADGKIDQEEVERELTFAIDQGVNYLDTSVVYEGSEDALGAFFSRTGMRDRVNLATKLPVFQVRKAGDADRIFEGQLERLRTDHVDFYLMHMLPDLGVWNHMVSCGIEEFIARNKASGRIRNIGFSYHGNAYRFKEIVDAYDWDFCQFQFNYYDYGQPDVEGLRYAASKGLHVVAMEPVRGGMLADVPQEVRDLFERAKPGSTPAEWAIRYVLHHPEVGHLLSGMNSMEMVEENIRLASTCEAGNLSEEELAVIDQARALLSKDLPIKCTGCGKCMELCPRHVDIKGCFRHYNDSFEYDYKTGQKKYMLSSVAKSKACRSDAALCSQCGRCDAACPEHIKISDEMRRVKKRFPLFSLPVVNLVVKIMYHL